MYGSVYCFLFLGDRFFVCLFAYLGLQVGVREAGYYWPWVIKCVGGEGEVGLTNDLK